MPRELRACLCLLAAKLSSGSHLVQVRLGTCDPSSGLAWRWDSSSGGALPLVDGLAASLAAAAGGLSGDGGAGDVEPTEGDAAEVVAGEEEEDELEEGEEREPGECSPGAGPASRMQAADPWRTIVCTAAQAWAESLRQGAAAPEAAGAASRLRVVVLTLAGAAQQQRPPASWLVRVLAEAMLRAQVCMVPQAAERLGIVLHRRAWHCMSPAHCCCSSLQMA